MTMHTGAADAVHAPASDDIVQAVEEAMRVAEAHVRDGQFAEAEQLYLAMLQLLPAQADANRQLGLLALAAGNARASLPFFASVLEVRPEHAASWLDYIEALLLAGEQALAQQILALGRQHGLDSIWADQLQRNIDGRAVVSTIAAEKRVDDASDEEQKLERLIALFGQGRYAEVEQEARLLTRQQPRHGYGWKLLGATLLQQRRTREALPCMQKAARYFPGDPTVQHNLAVILQELGNMNAAETACRNAMAMESGYLLAHSNLLLMQNYHARTTKAKRFADAVRFGQAASRKASAPHTSWSCSAQPRRLRIGLVSGDLSNHPVGHFLEALLGQLDPQRVELIAYPTVVLFDTVTARLLPHFAAWRPIAGMDDCSAAKMIENDGVHMLLDLAGHTGNNGLPVFAWRPAPVQISWLGYFATTGMQEMDYLLADAYVAPAAEAEHFVEKIWRMPDSYLCFTEPRFQIDVSALPALANGYVTFACFNNLAKMNDAVVAVWARILHAVPQSRLFLKTKQLDDAALGARTLARFARQGIDAGRLRIEGTGRREQMLASYQQADMVLDPFPYPGGTTSMEALWMGLPIVTRRGSDFLSHLGESILHNAGLPDWIANDDADYVAKACRFANDLEALSALRQRLRRQVLASPLYDAARFARHFEEALWGMWHEKMATLSLKGAQSCQERRW